MKRVFTAPTLTEAHLVMGALRNEGIEAVIKNEYLSGLAGEVPFMEAWPEVWIMEDQDFERAQSLLSRYEKG